MSMIGNFRLATAEVIAGLLADPPSVTRVIYDEDESGLLDVDKAWHGIHYLLCGEVWSSPYPLGLIVWIS